MHRFEVSVSDSGFVYAKLKLPPLIAGIILPVEEQRLLYVVSPKAVLAQTHEYLIILTSERLFRDCIVMLGQHISPVHYCRMYIWGIAQIVLRFGYFCHFSIAPYFFFIK